MPTQTPSSSETSRDTSRPCASRWLGISSAPCAEDDALGARPGEALSWGWARACELDDPKKYDAIFGPLSALVMGKDPAFQRRVKSGRSGTRRVYECQYMS